MPLGKSLQINNYIYIISKNPTHFYIQTLAARIEGAQPGLEKMG
jgi:hypothetical protein